MSLIPRITIIAIAAGLFLLAWMVSVPETALPRFPLADSVADAPPGVEQYWVSRGETAEAHSANIAIAGNIPVAVWYAGTEEGAADVALYMSQFRENEWTRPVIVTTRPISETGLNRSIRKIGNPALHVWPDGHLGVFYVTVSVGGWAASSINYIESPDMGDSWSQPKRLVTSPFINISTLVRGSTVTLDDGSILLPVYHEFIGKFGEALRLNRDIEVLSKERITHGDYSLQPTIAALSETNALALLRNSGGDPPRVIASTTQDGGLKWSEISHLSLSNPDSAIALLRVGDQLLAALNDTEDGRHRLSLAVASLRKPLEFKVVKVLEQEDVDPTSHEYQFSYPSLVQDNDGYIHLVYTWNQTRIRHWRFDSNWLEQDR